MRNLHQNAQHRRRADEIGRVIGRGDSLRAAQSTDRANGMKPVNPGPAGIAFIFDS